MQIGTNKVIDATNKIGTIGRLINHAPKPHSKCVGVVVNDSRYSFPEGNKPG